MNDQIIAAIVKELVPALVGKSLGRVIQLSPRAIVFDFQPFEGRYLYIDINGNPSPRIYSIARRLRDLEKRSTAPSPFTVALRTQFSGATLSSIAKDEGDRIVRFGFIAMDDLRGPVPRTMVAQLTGQSANLFALNYKGQIIASLRHTKGAGQQPGEVYLAPPPAGVRSDVKPPFTHGEFLTWSDAADSYYVEHEARHGFTEKAARIRARLKREIGQRIKLRVHLERDLVTHGDADQHKRWGDLILANLSTATRTGSTVTLNDYFSADGGPVEIEIDEQLTLPDAAAKRFAQYGKAKRAAVEIERRLEQLSSELDDLHKQESAFAAAVESGDEDDLTVFEAKAAPQVSTSSTLKPETKIPGVRRYLSSDGYEILVGRGAKDNDHLTFKIAKPNDLWLHAADYPGSHVVVRNRSRAELPQRTVFEAAQLAANFSQAKKDSKVDIHYTQRKFISKPKRSAPGLVRLTQFRTLTVEPKESGTRL